jgi:hypothetical protein
MMSTSEEFDYPHIYDLVIAAESIHWMDWEVVFGRLATSMSANGRLAIVGRGETSLLICFDLVLRR